MASHVLGLDCLTSRRQVSWASYRAWSKRNLDCQPVLISPVRYLWVDYKNYCAAYGFEVSTSKDFLQWLRGEEHVKISKIGTGRLRTMIVGAAVKVTEVRRTHCCGEDRPKGHSRP